MNGMSRQLAAPRARAFDTIVLGGLTAGVLDIIDAIVVTWLAGRAPARMLQAIASGVLGPDAYAGGASTAAIAERVTASRSMLKHGRTRAASSAALRVE